MTVKTRYALATGPVSDEPVKAAAERGVVLEVMEFIQIEEFGEIPGMEELAARPLTVVFTSVHAVQAVRRWINGPLPDWRIYCISGATYSTVAEIFGEASIVGKAASASKLAELIPGSADVIFFCGDQRRDELPALGVTEKIVYRTVLTPHRIGRDYDGIAFFSPSAVESFFSVNSIDTGIPLFAIGQTTAAAIHARCSNPVVVGGKPDKALLIREMADHLLNKR